MGRLKTAWWMGGLLACTWVASAHAQTCEQDADCPKGFHCDAYMVDGPCSVAPCQQGESCDAGPECTSEVRHECRPSACETDADCATDMICFEQTSRACSGGAETGDAECKPGETCTTPEQVEPDCTEQTVRQCTPRYLLPCEQDTDCGDGFACKAFEECSCSGAAGDPNRQSTSDAGFAVGGSDAGSAFVPVPANDAGRDGGTFSDAGTTSDCECHMSDAKRCELTQVQCDSDADCPSNFVCNTYSWGTASCAVSKDSDAAVCEPIDMQSGEEKRCEPRYNYGGLPGRAEPAADSGSHGQDGATSSESGSSNASDAGVLDDDASTGDSADGSGCSVSGPGERDRGLGQLLGVAWVALGLAWRRRPR